MAKKIVNQLLLYSSETLIMSNKTKSVINAMEMGFLRKLDGKTRKVRIRNEILNEKLGIKLNPDENSEKQLNRQGHMHKYQRTELTKRVYEVCVQGTNRKGRPRKTWQEEVKEAAGVKK